MSTQMLLDMLKESMQFWRYLVFLLIGISFLKFALRLWYDLELAKLQNKDSYSLQVSAQGDRSIAVTSSNKNLLKIASAGHPAIVSPKNDEVDVKEAA